MNFSCHQGVRVIYKKRFRDRVRFWLEVATVTIVVIGIARFALGGFNW